MSAMTVAEAKAAGLLSTSGRKKPRTTRKAAPRDGHISTCVTCGTTFTTDAAETRHVEATTACRRYESEIT